MFTLYDCSFHPSCLSNSSTKPESQMISVRIIRLGSRMQGLSSRGFNGCGSFSLLDSFISRTSLPFYLFGKGSLFANIEKVLLNQKKQLGGKHQDPGLMRNGRNTIGMVRYCKGLGEKRAFWSSVLLKLKKTRSKKGGPSFSKPKKGTKSNFESLRSQKRLKTP